jgi:histidine triad (HIT) family protein
MYNHAPPEYICPICLAVAGIESEKTMMRQKDIFYKDNLVMAAINSKFVGNNPGHVIIVPLDHYENLYDIPDMIAERIVKVSKRVAVALRTVRACEGINILQNNEPRAGQHAFHYHMHLFPRFPDDQLFLNMANARVATSEERLLYSEPLKEYFGKNPIVLD